MSKSFQKFDIGERCVCIYEDDGQPYAAQIHSIEDGRYRVHYNGWTSKWDCEIPIGQEGGILFKGSLEEYAEKYGVEVSDWALQHSRIVDDQPAGPVQMDSYGRTYTRRIFVRGDDSSGRRRSRRLTLGGPSTSTALEEPSAKKVKVEVTEYPEEDKEEVHRYPFRRQSQKIPMVQQIPEVAQDQEEGEDPQQDIRRLRSGKVVVKEEPEDVEPEEEEEPRKTYRLRSRTVEPEEDAEESEGSDGEDEVQESEDEAEEEKKESTRRSYSLRSRAEVKEEAESEESEGSDQEEEEDEPLEPRRSYVLRSRTVEPESEEDELEESDEPEEEDLEIPDEEPEVQEEPRRSYSLRSRTVEPESEESDDEEEATVRCYPLRSRTVEPEESEDDVVDYEDAEEQVVSDYEDAGEEPEEEQDEPEAPESEDEPRRKLPLRTTSNLLASPSRPAKRSLVQEVQVQNPRRRCPFTRPDKQPQCYPDASKIGTLAGLFNDRSKIRLPGATHIIEHVDRKMQVSIPWCTPIVPAAVPVDEIVRDYMADQGHIRANQLATPAQLAQLAPGIAELVKIFNLNIETILTDTEKVKFMEVTAGELPSKIYGVIHLMRMMAKLHEWTMPLKIFELVKEESRDFLKFIDVNYKKYYQRELEYPIDKHGFESRTGILFLERNI
ncbi:hypothetical protein B9Z55_012192 [Caenorhabditis nigoni]|uniref:MRG domain-containing protein n=1 Tax=Caenorhabditis nigoni TaxID=1611254 RepID=A0A2G5TW77_9PELO|nr:hypothetical protein B9Z55_012192 [Caenorhabditis nigoni]